MRPQLLGSSAIDLRTASVNSVVAKALPSEISVLEIDLRDKDPAAWDLAAERAGGSMRSAHAHLVGLRLKHLLKGKARTYELFLATATGRVPIGFTTLAAARPGRQFYDGLLLYREYQHLWKKALEAVLQVLPSGVYHYGWQWNLEATRLPDVQSLKGVEIISHEDIWIQGVDFSKWDSWESYFREISANIRRNLKKAEAEHSDLAIDVKVGLASLLLVPRLIMMRRALCARKDIPFNTVRIAGGYLFTTLTCPSQPVIAAVKLGNRAVSIQNLTRFGSTTYYLDGASLSEAGNVGWYLQMFTIRQAFERAPKGKYLVGYTDGLDKTDAAMGLLRSRAAIRVSQWPTSRFKFKWTGANLSP